MIHPQISELADTFEQETRSVLLSFPHLVLDGTWPAMGLIDLMLFHLRGRDEYTPEDIRLLQACAAYVGKFLYSTWKTFGDGSECSLTFGAESGSEICLVLRGGAHLKDKDEVILSVSSSLTAILRELPNPLPIFESYRYPITPLENLLSPVLSGMATAITPYATGPLATKRIYELTQYLLHAQRHLAESSARHYKRIHAGEEIGQDAALYMSGLLFPPAGYDEKFAYTRAAVGLTEYFLEKDLLPAQMEQAAFNLANSPDSLIATTGFVVLAALASTPSPSLIALSENKRIPVQRLRPALVAARKLLGKPHDWMELADEGQGREAVALAAFESALGFLPLMRSRPDLVADKRLKQLHHAIAWGDLTTALQSFEQAFQLTATNPQVGVQGIFLDIAAANFESAEAGILALKQHFPDDEKVVPQALRLGAQIAMYREDWSESRALLENALRYESFTKSERCEIMNELAYMYLLSENPARSLEIIDQALKLEPFHVTHRLNRIAALQLLGRDADAAAEGEVVARSAPTDPRVFETIRTLVIPARSVVKH